MNPLAVLTLCASAWVTILGLNSPCVSTVALAIAILFSLDRRATILGTLAISLPVCLSMLLVHGLFGQIATAVHLSLRAAALVSVLLSGFTRFSAADLAKALQGSGLSPRVAYILGVALQTLPTAQRYAGIYLEQAKHLHKPRRAVFALVTRMLVHGTDRALAAKQQGVELSGKRTVLRPVPFTKRDTAACVVAPLVAIGAVIWH